MKRAHLYIGFFVVTAAIFCVVVAPAQKPNERNPQQKVRTVTIPISIYTKQELESNQASEFVQAERLVVKEDKEEQTILSIRSDANTPLTLAILIQDDLTANINLQLPDVANYIRHLPKGTRVMVAYIRGGSLDVRQKFTEDLEKAAKALRIVSGVSSGTGPYDGVSDSLGRFDGLPGGRRAILLVSDGLDSSQGVTGFGPVQSVVLDNAITKAQKRNVAVYSFYSPTNFTDSGSSSVVLAAQSSLQRISDETGGRAFFQGTRAPISFEPFFKDFAILVNRQFALTYLSTHMNKGYHRVDVTSTNPVVKIEHPKGYFYR